MKKSQTDPVPRKRRAPTDTRTPEEKERAQREAAAVQRAVALATDIEQISDAFLEQVPFGKLRKIWQSIEANFKAVRHESSGP